jgi:hypothetical protein
VAGHIGYELRCAERKFISLRSRVTSNLGDTAQTVRSFEEDNLPCWGRTVPDPTLRAAHQAVRPSGARTPFVRPSRAIVDKVIKHYALVIEAHTLRPWAGTEF